MYQHFELAEHDVVLAEGLPAETYLDTGDRAKFAGAPVIALYPDFSVRMLGAMGCAPLVVTRPALATVRARFARRTAQLAVRETDRQRVAATGSSAA